MKWRLATALLSALLVLPLVGACETLPPEEEALQEVEPLPWVREAEKEVPTGVHDLATAALGASEVVVHAIPTELTVADDRVYRIVVFDTDTQETRKLTLDDDGRSFDLDAWLDDAADRDRQAYGNLTPRLATQLRELDPDESVRAQVRFDAGSIPDRPDGVDGSDYQAYRAEIAERVLAARGQVEQYVVATGGEILTRARYSPVLEVQARAGTILTDWSASPLIREVVESTYGLPKHRGTEHSTDQLGLPQTFYLAGSYLGQGIRVGITGEGHGGCGLDEQHALFWFSSVTNKGAPRACTVDADCDVCDGGANQGYCRGGACTVFHGTCVAGAIGHTVDFAPRIAPAVDLYYVADGSSHADELDWLMDNEVVVENESWGGATDVHEQDRVSIVGMHVVEIAGNGGDTHYSSCHANNTLCVGGYAVNGATFSMFNATSSVGFDSCSRWKAGCDRETPHVVFRGQSVQTTTNDPNDADGLVAPSGTSVAAPIGVGLVALMVDRWPYPFLYWPEVTRATLMASATQDVHTPVAGKAYSDYRPPDERDGAGIPDATRIEAMVDGDRVMRLAFHRDDDFDSGDKTIIARAEGVQAGQRVRAVLSWTGCPNSKPNATVGNGAHADLDLHVLDPNGNRVFNAASYDGTYEIAEFVAATSGTYEFEVQHFGWASCSELGGGVYAGFAYDVR